GIRTVAERGYSGMAGVDRCADRQERAARGFESPHLHQSLTRKGRPVFDDDDVYDELDQRQSALNAPGKWSWASWASIQLSNLGDTGDTVGKMVHDAALHLQWHANHLDQKRSVDDAFQAIADLPEVTNG